MRETLLNAVVHKDYGSGIPIQISVYDDHIVFWNPGVLPESWTLKRLLGKHYSQPFNPLIAGAFFRAGYIEAWGRGIEKIQTECRTHGIEPPTYEIGPNGLMVTFHTNPAHTEVAGKSFPTTTTTRETTREKILALLRSTPAITRRELAEKIGITSDGIKYHLKKLAEDGTIRHVGPTKAGHWEVLR